MIIKNESVEPIYQRSDDFTAFAFSLMQRKHLLYDKVDTVVKFQDFCKFIEMTYECTMVVTNLASSVMFRFRRHTIIARQNTMRAP